MTNRVVSLVEALRPRACAVAELLASRLADAGLWSGYRASEGMEGELRLASLLTYNRPGQPHAVLVFRNPQMTDITQINWGDPTVLESNIGERHASHIRIEKPVSYEDTISHTFAKTRNLAEQFKIGLEASLKVGGELGTQGGIHGVTAKVYAELALKIYGEYQRQWGESTTESNTASRKISAQGPIRVDYEAVRSMNREQRRIRADCDYEHSVELIDETGAGENPPYIQLVSESWAAFVHVARGLAPRHYEVERDGRKVLRETAFYDAFIRRPVLGADLEALRAPAAGAIEQLVEYDNVIAQDIRIL